jgi:hypothetical protein
MKPQPIGSVLWQLLIDGLCFALGAGTLIILCWIALGLDAP